MKSILKLVLASAIASLALVGTANAQHHGGGGGGFHGGGGAHVGGSAFHGGGGYHGGGYRGGYGGYRGGYGGYRSGWGGWGWGVGGLALGLTVASLPYAYSTYYYGGVPYYAADGVYYNQVDGGYQVVNPPVTVVQQAPAQAAMSTAPVPVIYPRNNQSAQQQESDQRQCNTWATSQPSAMNDGSVFQRSVAACMDARGYTLR